MKAIKNIKLTKAQRALVGATVPKEKNGNIGHFIQDKMDDLGYQTDHFAVVDIPKIKTEIKSKGIESTSAWGIGSMSIENIEAFDYDHSPIKEKMQTQFQVSHSQTFREIVKAETYNFSKECIQEKLRYAYNSAREKILNGCRDNYIRGENSCGYFERKKKTGGVLTNSWTFRIPVSEMEKLKGMAKSNAENLFEFT